MILTKLI